MQQIAFFFQFVLFLSLVVVSRTQFVSLNCSMVPVSRCFAQSECVVSNSTSCGNTTGSFDFCAPRLCMLQQNDTFLSDSEYSVCAMLDQGNVTVVTPVYHLFGIHPNCSQALPLGWTVTDRQNCVCPPPATPEKSIGLRIIPILVLIVVVFFLVYPVEVPVPLPKACAEKCGKSVIKIPLDFATVPVTGVLVLIAAGWLRGPELLFGIVGNGKIIPFAIVLTFFSLVYTCMSLEITGIFDYITVKTINSTKGSGTKLFFSVWLLTSVMTLSTSNDIAILTLTPIICSLSQYTGTKVTPFLFLQFFMANIWSMTLLIGNPTNIIVSTAYKINFAQYCHYMSLPALVCAFSCLPLVYFRFRHLIPETITMPEQNPEECWRDKGGAIYGVICLFCCICLLISSSWLGFPIYSITLSVAFLMFCKDIAYDLIPFLMTKTNCYQAIGKIFNKKQPEVFSEAELPETTQPKDDQKEDPEAPIKDQPPKKETGITRFQFVKVLLRLPWKIVFFLFSVFVIVKALQVADWTSDIARGLATAIGPEDSHINTVISVYLIGTVAVVSCNILNNQPMTILFTTVLQESSFVVSPSSHQGAMYALIMGSNLGADFTLIGALAGIMWAAICKRRGQEISPLKFISIGIVIMPWILGIGCGILCLELIFYPKN